MTTKNEIKGIALHNATLGYHVQTATNENVAVKVGDYIFLQKEIPNPKKTPHNNEEETITLTFQGNVIEQNQQLRLDSKASMLENTPLADFFVESAEGFKKPYKASLVSGLTNQPV